MAPSLDSMFLFEIVVDGLKSCIDTEFLIKCQFADVFMLNLKDPNEYRNILAQNKKKRSQIKTKVRSCKLIEKSECFSIENRAKMGQLMLACNIELLISNMENHPLELSLWSKEDLDMVGLTRIPWSLKQINYLKEKCEQHEANPVSVDGQYNISDKLTLKRIATVKLNVKLRHLRDMISYEFNSLSDNDQQAYTYTLPTNIMNSTDKNHSSLSSFIMAIEKEKLACLIAVNEKVDHKKRTGEIQQSFIHRMKSDNSIDKNKKLNLIKSKSISTINQEQGYILNNIFRDTAPYGSHVYCVAYFTVENDFTKGTDSSKSKSSYENGSSLKKYRELPPKPDDCILIDLTNLKKQCCHVTEEVEGSMKGNMQFVNEPCMCTCECAFGFTKNTVYCTICGGYKYKNEDTSRTAGYAMPFPCPIFHQLVDKNKSKTLSTSGSDNKKKNDDNQKINKMGSKSVPSEKRTVSDKFPESETDVKKSKKNDRFKFNYGYKAPQIGHNHCAAPCAGVLGVVPNKFGWLWNSENVPGMKFRPNWKPGAATKHVVRLLKIAKSPGKTTAKKRRKDGGKMKRSLKRPLLTVRKNDGEFTVTMERMKVFSKQRSFNQYPYEDKPVLTYTIGRTAEENRQRQLKKESKQRRLERAQRQFIQSAFKNICHEICLKTYQQALAILPDAENPDCSCFPSKPDADRTNLDVSCSCSEDKSTSGTDTDSDEWIVEFTPPSATYYPTFKGKKVSKIDSSTQYTYLDYKVKLLDLSGNPIPRFFKGPDGKQQCSDLGGFWSPDKKWLEINFDGFIGPDNRWAPKLFIGPSGETVDCETGKFQDTRGTWLTIGVDGFIDSQGKWKFYRPPTKFVGKTKRGTNKSSDRKDGKNVSNKPSEMVWSCFGDVTPRELSKIGILGHGHDRRLLLDTLRAMLAQGQDVRIPEAKTIPHLPASMMSKKRQMYNSPYFHDRTKCKHSTPSDKGITAVDVRGNKTYFRLHNYKNRRPQERLAYLTDQGYSLNSFHLPCFQSFINSQIMKKQLYEKLQARYENSKCISMQEAPL